MICRKCANMFDDSLSDCPECGTPAVSSESEPETENSKKGFVLNIPEEEIEKPIVITVESKPEQQEEKQEASEETTESPEIKKLAAEPEKTAAEKQVRPKKETSSQKKTLKKDTADSIGDKSAAALIVSIVCILACMMTVLTFVSIKSDVFKSDGEVVKTVALSSLSGEETGNLEQWLPTVSAVCENEFDSKRTTVSELLKLVRPYDTNGIYQSLFGTPERVANTPDPAQRYTNENGDYVYYRISEEKIDAIVELFGLTVNHTVNADDFYYYDGYYYFGEKLDFEPTADYIVDVSSGKRIQDGSYYVECSFLQKDNLSATPEEKYAIVEKVTDEAASETGWKLTRISSEPIFDNSGVMIENEGEVTFEMKTEVIEKKAKDGTLYHKYIIEYPVFSGNSLGEQTANQLYSDMISAFAMEEDSVQSDYKRFIKYGGNADELPLLTHVISRVTYNENGYISVLEDTAEYIPASMPADDVEQQEENGEYEEDEASAQAITEPVALPKRTVEGYNFDVESGDFITKDEIIGKDYQVISELLYRIYSGYGYADIVSELERKAVEAQPGEQPEEESSESYYTNEEQPQEIPEDENALGLKIYESASVICESGFMFCFVTEDGCAHDVVIPFEIPHLFEAELL